MSTITRENTCCFTGHRPEKLPWGHNETDARCAALKARIADALDILYARGYRHFISGMALGADTYFCEAALSLRDRRDGVTVEAAIPFEGQASRWSPLSRERYERLCAACDIRTVLSGSYTKWCMHERNRYMVDSSSLLLAVFDGSTGGTKYTVDYALKRGLEVVAFGY